MCTNFAERLENLADQLIPLIPKPKRGTVRVFCLCGKDFDVDLTKIRSNEDLLCGDPQCTAVYRISLAMRKQFDPREKEILSSLGY